MDFAKFNQKILDLISDHNNFVVVTLTHIRGSAPQDLGAKMIVYKDDIIYGTVGGGKVESHCIKVAKDILAEKELTFSFKWNLQKDIGMTCGGEVGFLFEKYIPDQAWNIAIFGAGHVSQALTRTLLNLNCHLKVIDTRREWLDKLPTDSKLTKIHSNDPKSELNHLHKNTFVILMTKGHSTDVPILFEALDSFDFPYMGVIGSKSKRNSVDNELKSMGLNEDYLKRFICPIGEKIGSNDPFEISLSICAQLLKVRDQHK